MGRLFFWVQGDTGAASGKDQARLALSRLLPAHMAWELTLTGEETE